MAILSDLGSCSLGTLLTGGALIKTRRRTLSGRDRVRESRVKLFREKVIVANWPDGRSSGKRERERGRVVGEDRFQSRATNWQRKKTDHGPAGAARTDGDQVDGAGNEPLGGQKREREKKMKSEATQSRQWREWDCGRARIPFLSIAQWSSPSWAKNRLWCT
ncbi:hypothetical protein CEP52_014737 [Fusarium oligoseptatum]|uniref:Uncharacterized protein n=2 Tax=Fusarium solani species complex TaxID=232080 RepID=A0A428SJI8_9HYPO|nr:hypothetical protein CEP51_005293 [Fusarium floridanum]RSL89961.1 hypothetical protein CEP52_014737 [Fusarium oligoseptatum]